MLGTFINENKRFYNRGGVTGLVGNAFASHAADREFKPRGAGLSHL